jgi:iron-sulfur cluster repair protein YtfE (RIC family)
MRRDASLIPLSHDHHIGLVRVFLIREAIRKNENLPEEVEATRAFAEGDLRLHFLAEEEVLVPLLRQCAGLDQEVVDRLVDEHREMERKLPELRANTSSLEEFADLLEAHIRFEERTVFPVCEERTTPAQRVELEAGIRRVLGRPADEPCACDANRAG